MKNKKYCFWVKEAEIWVYKKRPMGKRSKGEVWINTTLLYAPSAAAAYRKAIRRGKDSELKSDTWKCNGRPAENFYVGIFDMGVISKGIYDGVEVLKERHYKFLRTAKKSILPKKSVIRKATDDDYGPTSRKMGGDRNSCYWTWGAIKIIELPTHWKKLKAPQGNVEEISYIIKAVSERDAYEKLVKIGNAEVNRGEGKLSKKIFLGVVQHGLTDDDLKVQYAELWFSKWSATWKKAIQRVAIKSNLLSKLRRELLKSKPITYRIK